MEKTYNLCVISNGKKHPLSYNFKSKAEADKVAKEKNKNRIKFVIGGRGFKNKKEALAWKAQALKHPPLQQTREEYEKVLKIEPNKNQYKIGVCKN